MSQEGFHHALKIGHQIHWYTIDKVLGQGGFGITYLGHDNNLDQRVAIKEFLPTEFAVRADDQSIKPITREQDEMYHWALDRFISEARTLAKFDHPNIVRVMTVFEENNAAYMVMRYEEGETLEHVFRTRGILSQAELLDIVLPIIEGLKIVHNAGFIHRDIKPANIFIRKDGSPVLIDFGSARQSIGAQTQTLTTLISPGYSPIEQYYTRGEDQGPWTDIYGLASTIYRGVAGKRPVDTMTRSKQILADQPDPYIPAREAGQGQYTSTFLQAIDNGLEFRHQHRPHDLMTWERQLLRAPDNEPVVGSDEATVPAEGIVGVTMHDQLPAAATEVFGSDEETEIRPGSATGPVTQVKTPRTKWIWPVIGLAAVLIIAFLVVVKIKRAGKAQNQAREPATVSVPAPATTPIPTTSDPARELPVQEDEPDQVETLLTLAEQDMQANRLTLPRGRNAFERYREVLKIEPGNQIAKQGLRSVATRKMAIIEKAIRNRNFDRAQKHLDHMKELLPENRKIKRLDNLIRNARNAQ